MTPIVKITTTPSEKKEDENISNQQGLDHKSKVHFKNQDEPTSKKMDSPSRVALPGFKGQLARQRHQQTTTPSFNFPLAGSPQIASGSRGRAKVSLKPKHSAMDWEHLKSSNSSNTKLRANMDPSSFPLRITKDELSKHNKLDDFWVCIDRKVYDLTSYLDFHPGGVEILKAVAGKDGTALFNKYHRWVSAERILDGCMLGFLV
ncbi:binding protein [[Candida] boidinii]|nr:binding protein [[Candida] boidinii]OWB61037.1 binding protein [[Candida] boidinii]OWB72250.1 binding protein [[Candida] boidinii]OWB76917.1 binding protein [[Candida] boidinii]GMF37706.1 unnamed protein product [[Candida] boidinii]